MSGKSLRRDALHSNFQHLLSKVTPNSNTVSLMKIVMEETHQEKLKQFRATRSENKRCLMELEERKKSLIEHILLTKEVDLKQIYEAELKAVNFQIRKKEDTEQDMATIKTDLSSAVGTAIEFISNPLKIWDEGGLEHKKLVLTLVFAKPIKYDKNNGFGTASMTLPFKVLTDIGNQKSKVVVCS